MARIVEAFWLYEFAHSGESVSQRNVKREVQQIDSVINRAIEQMQLASHRESGVSGLASGFTGIDAITSGWQNSQCGGVVDKERRTLKAG